MTLFALNILLALAWAALWGGMGLANLVAGFVLGFIGLRLVRGLIPASQQGYFRALPQSFALAAYFFKELAKSCIQVARDCIARKPNLTPTIVHMPLDVKTDLEIFLVANLITLTPGTLTLDVAEDRSYLVVHSIYGGDDAALIADLKSGMEAHVMKVFHP